MFARYIRYTGEAEKNRNFMEDITKTILMFYGSRSTENRRALEVCWIPVISVKSCSLLFSGCIERPSLSHLSFEHQFITAAQHSTLWCCLHECIGPMESGINIYSQFLKSVMHTNAYSCLIFFMVQKVTVAKTWPISSHVRNPRLMRQRQLQ